MAPVYLWTISGKPLVNLWTIPPVSVSRHGAVEGLKRMAWREADLRARRKAEPRKVELAGEVAFADDEAAGVARGAAQPGHQALNDFQALNPRPNWDWN